MNLIPFPFRTLMNWVMERINRHFGVSFDLTNIELDEGELADQLGYGRD